MSVAFCVTLHFGRLLEKRLRLLFKIISVKKNESLLIPKSTHLVYNFAQVIYIIQCDVLIYSFFASMVGQPYILYVLTFIIIYTT